MASDVIFSDGRNLLDAMIGSLRDLQAAEQAHLRAELRALARQRWLTFGALAALWMVGLVVLAPCARELGSATRSRARSSVDAANRSNRQPRPPHRVSVDLAAAATVCTDLSRITTTSALPGLLGRAAGALDASGLILWISAGEQLFPVMAHGYSDDMLARMGPIARDAGECRRQRLADRPADGRSGRDNRRAGRDRDAAVRPSQLHRRSLRRTTAGRKQSVGSGGRHHHCRAALDSRAGLAGRQPHPAAEARSPSEARSA